MISLSLNFFFFRILKFRLCLVEWILEKMGKKRRENVEGKLFGGCLIERERERKMMMRPKKKFSPKWRENFLEENLSCIWVVVNVSFV